MIKKNAKILYWIFNFFYYFKKMQVVILYNSLSIIYIKYHKTNHSPCRERMFELSYLYPHFFPQTLFRYGTSLRISYDINSPLYHVRPPLRRQLGLLTSANFHLRVVKRLMHLTGLCWSFSWISTTDHDVYAYSFLGFCIQFF